MIKLLFSCDDGGAEDIRLADMLYHYDFQCTFYIPVNWQKYLASKGIEPLTSDMVDLLASQFEIGSHGTNHEYLTRINGQLKEVEINTSKMYWQERLGRPVTKFCYARGYYDDNIKKRVQAAGYASARTVKVGNLSTDYDPYEQPTTVHVGYDRDEYGTDWFTYAKDKVKEAITKANMGEQVEYHAWMHSAEVSKYDQWDRVKKFMEYLYENLPS